MKTLRRFKFFLCYFGFFKVALIGYLRPRLLKIDEREMVVCLPLTRRSRNHLGSMYFGALAVGADLAAGLHGFYHAEQQQCKISLLFKSFSARFLKRPQSDVYFVSSEGEEVKAMLEESRQQAARVNRCIKVLAFTDYPACAEPIAEFNLELSIKVL